MITHLMRQSLKERVKHTTDITVADFHLVQENLDNALDIYVVAQKSEMLAS